MKQQIINLAQPVLWARVLALPEGTINYRNSAKPPTQPDPAIDDSNCVGELNHYPLIYLHNTDSGFTQIIQLYQKRPMVVDCKQSP